HAGHGSIRGRARMGARRWHDPAVREPLASAAPRARAGRPRPARPRQRLLEDPVTTAASQSPSAPRPRRVILNTDAKNEADDQFAIVHALLSETLDMRGLIAAHFGEHRSTTSMLDSRAEIDHLLDLMGREDVRVENGAAAALPAETTPADSPGARLILAAAPGR